MCLRVKIADIGLISKSLVTVMKKIVILMIHLFCIVTCDILLLINTNSLPVVFEMVLFSYIQCKDNLPSSLAAMALERAAATSILCSCSICSLSSTCLSKRHNNVASQCSNAAITSLRVSIKQI